LRSLTGQPNNFNNLIIGKITNKQVERKERKDSILIIHSLNDKTKGYKAAITSINLKKSIPSKLAKIPLVHSIKNIDILNDEDVAIVNMKNGNITIVYEKQSMHNSIFATARCNCKCIMCPQPPRKDPRENIKINMEILKFIDKSSKSLGITGGEPTLLKDKLIQLLKQCKKYLPDTSLALLTNGILLKYKNYVQKIVEIGNKNLIFCIPLYADTDYEHDFIMQKKGAFENAILGLHNLASFEQLVEIRVVIHALNYKRLTQIAEFIYHNFPFVIHIAFMGMETIGFAKKNIKRLWIAPPKYMPMLKEAVLYFAQRYMTVSIYNEQLCLLDRDLWPFSCKSISEWKNYYLDECKKCNLRNQCGGLFASAIDKHKKLIQAI